MKAVAIGPFAFAAGRFAALLGIFAFLVAAAILTVEGLWAAIGRISDFFTPQECQNFFQAAGYDPI